jgi:Cyclic nucleotide-binding domain
VPAGGLERGIAQRGAQPGMVAVAQPRFDGIESQSGLLVVLVCDAVQGGGDCGSPSAPAARTRPGSAPGIPLETGDPGRVQAADVPARAQRAPCNPVAAGSDAARHQQALAWVAPSVICRPRRRPARWCPGRHRKTPVITLAGRHGKGHHGPMRHESSVTSLSWIPSEAITGGARVPFDAGIAHYDEPPPGELTDVEELRAADRFRFANVLRAWIEVDGSGRIGDCGYGGGGRMGSSTVRLGALHYRFQAVQLPDLQHDPEQGDGWARFVQTTGGRTGAPMPRRVARAPYVRWQAPLVWTTLSLTLRADGRAEFAMTGASRFPRHWVYGADGVLAQKSGLTDWEDWYRKSSGRHSPWGDEDSSALVMAVETALERALSVQLMHGGAKPRIDRLPAGATLARQGRPGTDVYLVLDGIIRVERDGETLAEYGPGALLGERAPLEGGVRTSSLVAVTPCRVAAVDAGQFDRSALEELSEGHRREDPGAG